jgi:hypothetical protein
MKLNKIDEGLFIRGRFFKLDPRDKFETLRREGITTVVNLIRPEDWDLYQQSAVGYIHTPVVDGRLPEAMAAYLLKLAGYLAKEIRISQHSVLIFCNAGRTRSGLLAALVLRELHGISGRTALNWVRERRPLAVSNDHFERFLNGLEAPRLGIL